jgi:hypothetical protein
MTVAWNVKAIYPNGGHIITDVNNNKLRFDNEESAKNEALILNSNKTDSSVHYICVKES